MYLDDQSSVTLLVPSEHYPSTYEDRVFHSFSGVNLVVGSWCIGSAFVSISRGRADYGGLEGYGTEDFPIRF